jgi:hypothetical protein
VYNSLKENIFLGLEGFLARKKVTQSWWTPFWKKIRQREGV